MTVHGISNSAADIWLHFFPLQEAIYSYPVDRMKAFLFGQSEFPQYRAATVVDGVSARRETGWGFLVDQRVWFISRHAVPKRYLNGIDWKGLTDRQLGLQFGPAAVLAMLNDGALFHFCKKPFWELDKKQDQYAGRDITNNEITLELKTERVLTKPLTTNLFVQVGESNHQVNVRPDGSYLYTEARGLS